MGSGHPANRGRRGHPERSKSDPGGNGSEALQGYLCGASTWRRSLLPLKPAPHLRSEPQHHEAVLNDHCLQPADQRPHEVEDSALMECTNFKSTTTVEKTYFNPKEDMSIKQSD